MNWIQKRILYMISIAISFGMFLYVIGHLLELKSAFLSKYSEHKEFLLALNRVSLHGGKAVKESDVSKLLEEMGLSLKRIYTSNGVVEVEISEVPWIKVPDLLYRIEKAYSIHKFSAVDNTGKGVFDVKLVLK